MTVNKTHVGKTTARQQRGGVAVVDAGCAGGLAGRGPFMRLCVSVSPCLRASVPLCLRVSASLCLCVSVEEREWVSPLRRRSGSSSLPPRHHAHAPHQK